MNRSSILSAVEYANLAQKLKMLVWKKYDENIENGGYYLTESDLDDIAKELYNYIKKAC